MLILLLWNTKTVLRIRAIKWWLLGPISRKANSYKYSTISLPVQGKSGESRTSQLSDHSVKLWLTKLYFIFIYSAWTCIYKHSYIHILSLISYRSIIAATSGGHHRVLPSPKSATARVYGIDSPLESGQPWGWCWTMQAKRKPSRAAVRPRRAQTTGNSIHKPVHGPLSTRVWPYFHLMRWLHQGIPNLLSQNRKNASTSHHFCKRTRFNELPRSFGSPSSSTRFQTLFLLQNDQILVSQHGFRFNTHYKKVGLQTALNFVHWLITEPNKKEISWANFFHELLV